MFGEELSHLSKECTGWKQNSEAGSPKAFDAAPSVTQFVTIEVGGHLYEYSRIMTLIKQSGTQKYFRIISNCNSGLENIRMSV